MGKIKNISNFQIAFLAILACFIWGSAFAMAKIAFEYMPPVRLSGFRFMLAGVILLPLLFIQRYNWRELKGQWGYIALFSLVQTVLQYGLFYYGLNLVPGAISAIINGASPLFITLLAHFTLKDDRINLRKAFAVGLGLTGVAFISINNGVDLLHNPKLYYGITALILSSIVGSSANIIAVKHKKQLSSVALTSVSCFLGGVVLYLGSLFAEPEGNLSIVGYPLEFYWALLWLAMIPATGFSIWYYLLKLPNVKVSELNLWKFFVPVSGVILSWMLLPGEYPNAYTVSGIVVISVSIIILQMPKRKKS